MQKTQRLLSLDVFRGITIATMIIVNVIIVSPYAALEHSEWHGCTIADVVFPFFIFAMGVSLSFSISKKIQLGIPRSDIFTYICQRTVIIFGLGLLLHMFPHHLTVGSLSTIRIYGVLQRIALCYLFAASAFLFLNTWMQACLTVILLVGYWLIMMHVPLLHYGTGNLSPEGNVAAYVDRFLFSSKHLYGKAFDPEGLLSTLPAIATALLGNLVGIGLRTKISQHKKLCGLIIAGTVCSFLGWTWGQWFPINKALWTSSYMLWTGGLALYIFAACYWVIEIKQYKQWSKPFEIFGLNAIVVFFLHVLFFKIQLLIHVPCGNGHNCNLRNYIIQHAFGWASLPYASLYYAITTGLFWLLILTIMYRKKIFIGI